ncbi:MAG: ribbon-helix-helix protein, CopG family, partial [Candidatus Methanomethylophilaceae archaeon]|nr:ribbon-helix-helix protein, CopG family [Candidatus Methanomethylophilaceae archaeon]
MGVTSVSLNEESLRDLDRIQEEYGLRGRSEAVRVSIAAAMDEIRELGAIQGDVEGVLIIV